jgi:uncharacterized phiE125 gp8 family phage protein
MALIRIAAAAVNLVSTEEMKAHLRVDYDQEDSLIDQYVAAACLKLEQRCARAFAQQTWEVREATFADTIEIPKPSPVELVQATYFSSAGVEETVDAAAYALVEGGEFEPSSLIWVGTKPSDLFVRPDAARVRFKTGWVADDFPEDLKLAIMLTAAAMFELRQDVLLAPTRQEVLPLPEGASTYIAPYIIPRL